MHTLGAERAVIESPDQSPEKRIIVDDERVRRVLGTLLCTYENGEYPYSLESTRLPHDHDHLPDTLEIGSQAHAMFLFTACYYMRGGIRSVDAVKRLGTIYRDTPELFEASVVRETDPSVIATSLKDNGLGFQKTVSQQWVENARRLNDRWGGDPRRIFDGVTDYDTALERIQRTRREKGFVGFQEKMTSMITYYLMDEGMIAYFDFPLPVDMHVLRVSIEHELVRFEGYQEDENVLSDELLTILRRYVSRVCVNTGSRTTASLRCNMAVFCCFVR